MAISLLPKVIIGILLCFATQISDRVGVQVTGFEMPTRVSEERKAAELWHLSINTVKTVKDSFSSKEPIHVQFHFTNVSKTVLTVKQVPPGRDLQSGCDNRVGEADTSYRSRKQVGVTAEKR